MTTKAATSGREIQAFQKLVKLMKKTPGWGENSLHTKTMEDLCTNTSKEAKDVRDIMWRMVGAELKATKKDKKTV
jgi:hypothetical protein